MHIPSLRAGCLYGALMLLGSALHPAMVSAEPLVQAITGASVVNLDGGKAIENATVLIEGAHILAVGPSGAIEIPDGATRIDMSGKYLLPGLMNMHVHLGLKLPGVEGAALANETDAELALRMAENARKTLYSGTTTVRLPGEENHVEMAVKAQIDRSVIDGPRIFSAGEALIPTGGHGSESLDDGVDGEAAVITHVRRQIASGASWIKIMISKGIASPRGDISAADMTFEEMRAATTLAHRYGAKVTAHSGSPQATLEALRAGVDGFEHGYFLTEEVFREIKKRDAWYVPTIVVSQKGALAFFEKIGAPAWYLERAKSVGKAHWQALQTAIKVGVNIAMGSDQLPFEPNDGTIASVRETQHYVEAGMTPVQALRAATIEPARMLGIDGDVGLIEAGKLADIIAVDGNPATDIAALRNIGFVMKGGKVIRNDWRGD